ncbi:amidohydrolase family protein [Pseudonocardia adelaidensis]|uniref:Amidohydrolase family protein n=1 Tax=Pseudonocardia adelaidensis TaxID=648754 RepID=A0ABP9P8V8_9PSEU
MVRVMRSDLAEHVAHLRLVDHHVHGAFTVDLDRAEFETHLNEGSPGPVPDWMTQFDSQLGFAIRRFGAPVLDLPAHAPADEYLARRTELGGRAVTERFLRAAGVSEWLVDTGYAADSILDVDGMAAASDGRAHPVVRLESLAEELAAEGVAGQDYADEFGARLEHATRDAVGVKSILAYRAGFDIDLSPPAPHAVADASRRWVDGIEHAPGGPRLVDPVLMRHGLHAAVQLGLPIQIHTGFGDRDLDLHRANPIHLLDFLRTPDVARVPIVLLHCYPYHREAGYLAQAFENVHFDVGLAINHVGVRSTQVVAESLELAPFAKQLYSSDAWGPPELHHLGAVLWRRAMTSVVGRWVEDGDWAADDALRVVDMIGRANALRVYGLG